MEFYCTANNDVTKEQDPAKAFEMTVLLAGVSYALALWNAEAYDKRHQKRRVQWRELEAKLTEGFGKNSAAYCFYNAVDGGSLGVAYRGYLEDAILLSIYPVE